MQLPTISAFWLTRGLKSVVPPAVTLHVPWSCFPQARGGLVWIPEWKAAGIQQSLTEGISLKSFQDTLQVVLAPSCRQVRQADPQEAEPFHGCLSWQYGCALGLDTPSFDGTNANTTRSHAAGSCKLSCCSTVGLDELFQPKWSYNQHWCSHYWVTVKAGQDELSEGNGNPHWASTNLPNQGPATQKDISGLYWFKTLLVGQPGAGLISLCSCWGAFVWWLCVFISGCCFTVCTLSYDSVWCWRKNNK